MPVDEKRLEHVAAVVKVALHERVIKATADDTVESRLGSFAALLFELKAFDFPPNEKPPAAYSALMSAVDAALNSLGFYAEYIQ